MILETARLVAAITASTIVLGLAIASTAERLARRQG